MKNILYLLFLVIIICSCSNKLKNLGTYNITYYNNNNYNGIKNIKTYTGAIVYLNKKDNIYKILENSEINFLKNKTFNLKKGICIIFNKKYYKNIDLEYKVFLKNQYGNCLFYRLKIPSLLKLKKNNTKIIYYHDSKNSMVNTNLNFLFKYKDFNYYGFFIPLNLTWKIENLLVDIEISDNSSFYMNIKNYHKINKRKWEEQDVYFKFSKSREIAKTDYEKFRKEVEERKEIYNKNNKKCYLFNDYNYPVIDIRYQTSEFGLSRKWKFYNGRIYSIDIHTGLDIANDNRTYIHSAGDGIVKYAKKCELVGNTVIIDHGLSLFTDYSHMAEIYVKPGDLIRKGQIIGLMGATGAATGPHLHWGARVNSFIVDPRSFFDIDKIFIP